MKQDARAGRRVWRVLLGLSAAVGLTAVLVTGASGATVGWNGEAIVSSPATGDGWEPAIAADPSQPYVYVAWMQYKGAKVSINVRVSADGGTTFGPAKPICATCNPGQYDIVLATTSTGTLYAVYMQGNNISFTKSTDHGLTFSAPRTISGGTWADKPWMATSTDGTDIYVGWSTRGNLVTVASHNAGATFSTPLQVTNESAIYYYPNGATVLPNGTAVIVASRYPEKGNATGATGPIPIVAFTTSNGGTSWTRTVVDTLNTGASFATSSVTTVASDAAGTLVLLYSGSTAVGANGKVYVRRSTTSGATWSAPAEMTTSAAGADATSVAAAGKATGQFVITWMDKRGGGWNVWERESANGGVSWSADAKVSDATAGAPYKTSSGFGLPYGDYDMVAINSAGKAVAAMGEGDSSQLHGDIWVNRKT
jgi:hypothetical protein